MVVADRLVPVDARQREAADVCRFSGRATSASIRLPGVAIEVWSGDALKTATSTDVDGSYRLALPRGRYRLTAELTGFDFVSHEVTIAEGACPQMIDLTLTLSDTAAGRPESVPARAPQSLPTLALRREANDFSLEIDSPNSDAERALLLPPGFSIEGPTQAVAVGGNMARLERGLLSERFDAIARGEFDPATGEFAPGFGPAARGELGQGVISAPGSGFGRGGDIARGGPPAGPGMFVLGGRGGRPDRFAVITNYTFGGSALDSPPYQLREDAPASQTPYTRQNVGGTFGGPLKIPGVYDGTRRTNFMLSYTADRGATQFHEYATVPTEAMRAGDFSEVATRIVDPSSGAAFSNNSIPESQLSATALALLAFYPTPNLPGTTRNFEYSTATNSSSDNINLRVMHSFVRASGSGGRGGGRGFGPGFPGGRGAGPGGQGTNINVSAQVQYRRSDSELTNVFPALGGETRSSSVAVPIQLNIAHRRQLHAVTLNISQSHSISQNRFAFVNNVSSAAGINGVSSDPFDWGVPQLSFSSITSLRDTTPSRRNDRRVSLAYTWTRPSTQHTFRAGADLRLDASNSHTDANPNGSFAFSGVYSSGGSTTQGSSWLDFADFLLGIPQQASLQYGPGAVRLSAKSMSVFLQDDWRKSSSVTVNLGVRYELLSPYVERDGRMANLDVNPDFTAAVTVLSGTAGPFSGEFSDALLNTDINNIAPRIGVAWRVQPGTVLRGGYGVSYNAGTYASIARQLVSQPPFATTGTVIGSAANLLSLSNPFVSALSAETTNSYGIDPEYALGLVQTWTVDLSRELRQLWNISAGYTHIRGSSLDMLRAPNRGPDGLRIDGVQAFLWETSEASSRLHSATIRARRRPANGIGLTATYTLARSRDNASSLGSSGSIVAQDDQNLAAEWGRSSFDRLHQLAADVNVELPFGPDRPLLNDQRIWTAVLRDWRVSATFTWQSGTPYTARVLGAPDELRRGTNGTLRADYTGAEVQLADPTIDRFFNTDAFAIPAPGTFGNSLRNIITGPAATQLNARIARDVRLGGNRAVTLQLNATNLLNLVNYTAIDATVNSPTFGRVLSVAPLRSMQLNLRFRF